MQCKLCGQRRFTMRAYERKHLYYATCIVQVSSIAFTNLYAKRRAAVKTLECEKLYDTILPAIYNVAACSTAFCTKFYRNTNEKTLEAKRRALNEAKRSQARRGFSRSRRPSACKRRAPHSARPPGDRRTYIRISEFWMVPIVTGR